MSEIYYLGAYWGPRKETVVECAARAQGYLKSLGTIDPVLTEWFEFKKSRTDFGRRPIPVSAEGLQHFLLEGADRRDTGAVVEELGFQMGGWAGERDEETLRFHMLCGCCSAHVPNSCVLTLPSKGKLAKRLMDCSVLLAVMGDTVRQWKPDWATVNSDKFRDLAGLPGIGIQVGWLTYISSVCGRVPTVAPPSRSIPVDHLGSIIVTTDEVFSTGNEYHVQQAMNIIASLREARLIRRHELTRRNRRIVQNVADACCRFKEGLASFTDVYHIVGSAVRSLDFEDPFRQTFNEFGSHLGQCNFIYDEDAQIALARETVIAFMDVLDGLGVAPKNCRR